MAQGPNMCSDKQPYVIIDSFGFHTFRIVAHEIAHTLVTFITTITYYLVVILVYIIRIDIYNNQSLGISLD